MFTSLVLFYALSGSSVRRFVLQLPHKGYHNTRFPGLVCQIYAEVTVDGGAGDGRCANVMAIPFCMEGSPCKLNSDDGNTA